MIWKACLIKNVVTLGFYFKTGLGRWDGKSSAYCEKCGKEINDSSKNH
jgi:hypothetical protein